MLPGLVIVFVIILWHTLPLWNNGGSRKMGRDFCLHGLRSPDDTVNSSLPGKCGQI